MRIKRHFQTGNMKSYQIKFTDAVSFESRLDEIKGLHSDLPSDRFLFYVTWSICPDRLVPEIAQCIERIFPDAIYYGNEVSASIIDGVHQYGIFICCQVLEGQDTKASLLWMEEGTEYSSLDGLWSYCRTLDGLKGVELIPSSYDNEYLGIDNSKINLSSRVTIFGGLSISCQELTLEASVFAKGHPIAKKGTAVILYFGNDLHIASNCIIGWKGLGRYMTVTRSSGKIIYEIDEQKPKDIYKKYLNLVDDESSDTLVFPLMLEEEGVEYLRTPRGFFPDGSVQMIVPIHEDSLVRIAYGDKNTILDSLYDKLNSIESFDPEFIKSFSCAARKWFWGDDDISRETIPLQGIATTNGFYTGGEILRIGNKIRVMNSTLVLISFREGDAKTRSHSAIKRSKDNSLLARITHFTGKIVQEQEEALRIAEEERKRNDIIHEIIQSNKWSFIVNRNDEVVSGGLSSKFQELTDINLSSSLFAWTETIHPDDKADTMAKFYAAIRDHSCKTPFDTTYRMMEKDGRYHWFRSAGRVVRDELGNGEFLGIHIDVSDQIEKQKENQKKIEDALAMAQSANKSKTTFLFNMSHDIRTPMNAIKGFTAMALKNSNDREKVTEYLNKIDLSGQQLLLLINQVLEMSRIESGRIEMDFKPVNLKERYESLVTILSEQAKGKGLAFNPELDIRHFNVLVDEARMSQIALNITGNAIKYTNSGGTIDFSLKETECDRRGYARFVFSVQDTGIGMSKEFQKVLYEPFTREKSSTVSRIQGTGLGLSIVKSLLELVGGKIEVHSEQGKGTRFDITVDLEIDNSASTGSETPAKSVNPDRLKGRRVLLVEDNALNREIAHFILEDMGMAVEEAEDGDIAVQMIKELFAKGEYDHFDYILMDVQMPVMDGYEATRQIRKTDIMAGVHIPILAMTANAFAEDRQNAMAAGMDGHLAKPIDVDRLKETLLHFAQ